MRCAWMAWKESEARQTRLRLGSGRCTRASAARPEESILRKFAIEIRESVGYIMSSNNDTDNELESISSNELDEFVELPYSELKKRIKVILNELDLKPNDLKKKNFCTRQVSE